MKYFKIFQILEKCFDVNIDNTPDPLISSANL